MSPLSEFLSRVERATVLVPPGNRSIVALTIAVGRLASVMQDMDTAPDATWELVEDEAVRVAALAARCALKGDVTIAVPAEG